MVRNTQNQRRTLAYVSILLSMIYRFVINYLISPRGSQRRHWEFCNTYTHTHRVSLEGSSSPLISWRVSRVYHVCPIYLSVRLSLPLLTPLFRFLSLAFRWYLKQHTRGNQDITKDTLRACILNNNAAKDIRRIILIAFMMKSMETNSMDTHSTKLQ